MDVNNRIMGQPLLDNSTHATTVIEYEHRETHEGNHYYYSSFLTIGSGIGSSLVFALTTPNTEKWVHFVYNLASTLQTESRLYEGAIFSGGTVVTPFNNNRNSTNASASILTYKPAISGAGTTSGTLISASSWGTATATPSMRGVGGASSRNREIVMKSGTTYLAVITSVAADNLISYDAEWYEHSDKSK